MVLVANMVVSTTTARPRVANLSTLRRLRAAVSAAARAAQARPATTAKLTTLQEANPRNLPEVWFRSTFPFGGPQPVMPNGRSPPPDPRKVKLGKSECDFIFPSFAHEPVPQVKPKRLTIGCRQLFVSSRSAFQHSSNRLSRRKSSRQTFPCISSPRRTSICPQCQAASPILPRYGRAR